MTIYSSADELPDLDVLFPPKPLMATSTNTTLRRSPRKKTANETRSPQKSKLAPSDVPTERDLSGGVGRSRNASAATKSARGATRDASLKNVPLLPRNTTITETKITSNNRRSPASPQRNLRLTHVDSLLLPLNVMAMEDHASEGVVPRPSKKEAGRRQLDTTGNSMRLSANGRARNLKEKTKRFKQKQAPHYTSRFVLKEARCNDDEEDSNDEVDDEDTDLSGFIVDDDAELSYHDTSALESDNDSDQGRRPPKKKAPHDAPRRRLQRGSPTRRRLRFGGDIGRESDKENLLADTLSNALQNVSLEDREPSARKGEIEVIDLTSSPAISPNFNLNTRPSLFSSQVHNDSPAKQPSHNSNPLDDFDAIIKLPPPSCRPALMLPSKQQPSQPAVDVDDERAEEMPADRPNARFTTPPATPPRSLSKLKSPSKLLSPSKRQAVPQSPHRQSMDAFWDHNVINDWNDEYSPKKAPAKSPDKRGLARFQIWSDSEDEEENNSFGHSDSLPSPCLSPRKSGSPIKSPEKAEKKRLVEEKRTATAQKKAFNSLKEQLALDLFHELDKEVGNAQLQKLSSSTGGVKIIWSKTLRSTAGRANWKRTVTKLSGSPIKGNPSPSDLGVKIQHFASIELAEKIIDCEDRLVNTLAHEFCHLTNFMISNVRDQPHGASFKKWAQKVTAHMRSTKVESWRKVEVTTKHSYVINHKYVWVCVGRPRTSAMEFLNVQDEDEGCGAEYGRHSKSIDVEKHRCGKCKGKLVQVRPKPRASPKKKTTAGRGVKREGSTESESASGSQTGGLGTMIETIELSE